MAVLARSRSILQVFLGVTVMAYNFYVLTYKVIPRLGMVEILHAIDAVMARKAVWTKILNMRTSEILVVPVVAIQAGLVIHIIEI